ncbi:tRNA pseudouridine(38-40) synthase TruA [Pokkaliibacter sp. CJK22405]|uniref:tRNA pseudouridine(38-40) synthase TruA n=1 Tax=Pokkaliibacter sp. CJK22405 TaxID=3384615 RepID=UPI0039856234
MQQSDAPALYRVALGVEYDGSRFYGWQSQKSGIRTVQAALEQALAHVANEPVNVVCAGRTDAGVHGSEQVVHFETHAFREMRAWLFGTNSRLPDDVCVKWASPVDDSFHARFSARNRRYRYVIFSDQVRPAVMSKQVTWTYKTLDVQRMQKAANYLLGEHDFTSFRAVQCQAKSPVRTLMHLRVEQVGGYVVLDVKANAFLHHMVRNLAGVLIKIGAGEAEPEWAKEVLEARDRTQGGVTAPPYGLYLVQAGYPDFELPQQPLGPHFLRGLISDD